MDASAKQHSFAHLNWSLEKSLFVDYSVKCNCARSPYFIGLVSLSIYVHAFSVNVLFGICVGKYGDRKKALIHFTRADNKCHTMES